MADGLCDHGAAAFTFIERLEDLSTVDAIMEAMRDGLTLFGFENFIITGLPNPQERFEQMVLLRQWPMGWFELYAREDYIRVDPVIRLCRRTTTPFEWTEAPYDPEGEPRSAEVMRRAVDYRMQRGFCLPIHGLNGYEACLSMSGVHLDLTARTKPAIHLMAMYAFERVRQIVQPERRGLDNPLTPREREVLAWAAAGKSAGETGEILGITERTVLAHTGNACQKLGAANKTQAVVRALQHRLISV